KKDDTEQRGDHAQLSQQAQIVNIVPSFDELPIGYTQHHHIADRDLPASPWNAHEAASVGATKGPSYRDGVSFSDQVLGGELGIGEGAEERREEAFVGRETLDGPGASVKHEVRGTQLIDKRRVVLI